MLRSERMEAMTKNRRVWPDHDPYCPVGYRLLVQSKDFAEEADFRGWALRVFGKERCKDMKIVPKFHSHAWPHNDKRSWRSSGFRAYIPRAE